MKKAEKQGIIEDMIPKLYWKHLIFLLGLALPHGLYAASVSVPTDNQGRPLFVDGQVVVRFDASIPDGEQEALAQTTGYKIIRRAHWSHVIVLQVPNGQVLNVIENLKQNHNFKAVYPNYRAYPFSTYTPYSFPNDPNYQNGNDEWNVNQVHMDQAWNSSDPWIATASLGRASAKIAIVDSGILATHEEFSGKIDPNSWNFVDNNSDISDNDTTLSGHGTSVAGIASVNTNNSLGGSGMCANCSLLIMKDTSPGGTIDSVAAAEGIDYAVAHGAKAINCSFGGTPSAFWANSYNAWQNGCLVIGAMGNDGNNTEYSPAGDTYAIGVGAVDTSSNHCSYSNYGSWIGLVVPVCGPSGTLLSGGIYGPTYSCNTCYGLRAGTSAAAPQVSALTAILLDQGLSPAAVTQCLYTTADLLGGGFNQNTGWGQMNAYRALSAIRPPSSLAASGSLNSVSLNWIAPQTTAFSTSNYIISRSTTSGGPYTLVGSTTNGSTLSFTDTSPNPNTNYYYVVQAVDAKGNTTVPSNEVSAVASGATWTLTPTPTATPDYGEFTNWTFGGLWHAVEDGVSPCANSFSHPWACYYGQASDCEYDTGSANSGTLTSSVGYDVCSGTDQLHFEAWWQSDGGDTFSVQYSPINHDAWTTLWSTTSTNSGGWLEENVSLAPVTLAPINIRFVVTTDSSPNTAKGWYVDDVSVANCLTPSPTPTRTITITPSPTITPTPFLTYTPTTTPTVTITPTQTLTPTLTPTVTSTLTLTPTDTPCGYPGFTCTPTLNPSTLIYSPVVYPNPIRDTSTHFTYQLSTPADEVTFKIFTVAYRKVAQFSGTTQDGQNSVIYDASNLANGLYWYVLEAKAGDKKEQRIGKLLILR